MNIERHRQLLFSGAAALGGTLLFAYAVRAVGLPVIADGIRRVGAGVFIILAIAGLRFCLRTQAWRLCMRPEVRLPFGVALRAFLAGDAIGSVTPLGLVASEPTKMLIASSRLPASEAVASLAVDNLVYACSAIGMVAVGVAVALATVPLSTSGRELALAALVLFAGGAIADHGPRGAPGSRCCGRPRSGSQPGIRSGSGGCSRWGSSSMRSRCWRCFSSSAGCWATADPPGRSRSCSRR